MTTTITEAECKLTKSRENMAQIIREQLNANNNKCVLRNVELHNIKCTLTFTCHTYEDPTLIKSSGTFLGFLTQPRMLTYYSVNIKYDNNFETDIGSNQRYDYVVGSLVHYETIKPSQRFATLADLLRELEDYVPRDDGILYHKTREIPGYRAFNEYTADMCKNGTK